MIEPNPEIFRVLSEEIDEDLVNELLYFGIWFARNDCHWRGLEPLTGEQVKDLVFDAVKKTFSAERRWDPQKGLLKPWLIDQVKSVIRNFNRKASTTREISHIDTADETAVDYYESLIAKDTLLHREDHLGHPEGVVLEKEKKSAHQTRISALYKAIEGDEELEAIFFAILEGCEPKPRFLSAKLGISTGQINNRLKRLRRHAQAIKEQMESEHE